MPFFLPRREVRQRNLRARTYQHGTWVSRELGRLGEKKNICPHLPSSGSTRAMAEFPCAPVRRRHFPGKQFASIYRITPSIYLILSKFSDFIFCISHNSRFAWATTFRSCARRPLRHLKYRRADGRPFEHTSSPCKSRDANCAQMRGRSVSVRSRIDAHTFLCYSESPAVLREAPGEAHARAVPE